MSGTEDFYRTLGVDVSADESAIRRAYKKRSLETHPDRFPVGSQAQREATGQFQGVNNAYYVLSDPARRREYDASRVSSPHAGSGGGSGFSSSSWWKGAEQEKRTADAQFESVFEEMMADEAGAGASHGRVGGRMYGLLGGGAGAVLGFIVANVPGALAGAVAGNRLGAIRDTKGKPVYQVFQEMPHAEKARMLSELLAKVMAQLS